MYSWYINTVDWITWQCASKYRLFVLQALMVKDRKGRTKIKTPFGMVHIHPRRSCWCLLREWMWNRTICCSRTDFAHRCRGRGHTGQKSGRQRCALSHFVRLSPLDVRSKLMINLTIIVRLSNSTIVDDCLTGMLRYSMTVWLQCKASRWQSECMCVGCISSPLIKLSAAYLFCCFR